MSITNKLTSLCRDLLPPQQTSVEQDSKRLLLRFPDGFALPTTDLNASRALFNEHKYDTKCSKWVKMAAAEVASCESWVRRSLDGSAAPALQTLLAQQAPAFLVDPSALTFADVVVMSAVDKCVDPQVRLWAEQITATMASISAAQNPGNKNGNKKAECVKGGSSKVGSSKVGSSEDKPEFGAGATNFIRQIVEEDLKTGKHQSIITRFPPEPNGFLHLGHAKSICLNFGLARDFKGRCHLRFDDTNPTKEDMRYINSIQEDVKWLGGDWDDHLYFTSDYFQQLYNMAICLIKQQLAYVDEQTEEEVRTNRGDVTTPGVNSRFRDRPIEENLALFAKMKAGEIAEGHCILRAKIDMTHGNMHMRDPPIYRVRFHPHPRTGKDWCVYPIYDFAHGQSDSIERITHSICTLEFEDHRPLYEWFQEKLGIFRTRQIEFARLNCTHVVMSKRKLIALVDEKFVADWDDPRLPTISAMRRRGFPSSAIRDFCEKIGVAKRATVIPLEYLETCVRNTLHPVALRRHVILHPLKVVITNLEKSEILECSNHPEDASLGSRKLVFSRELYIDHNDFSATPSPKFFRLAPGAEVRLRYGYWITCTDFKADSEGRVLEVHCTYDPTTKGGNPPSDGRKVRGTIHWVSAEDSIDAEVRMYDHLFTTSTPDDIPEGKTFRDFINPKSLEVVTAKAERCISSACHPCKSGVPFQFERVGFFVADYDSTPEKPIFNLTVSLTDSWAAQTDVNSKEAQAKEAAKLAREKAVAERLRKKEEKEQRLAAKLAGKQ